MAEVPMMLLDTIYNREMKCRIGVVALSIGAMHQRWALVCTASTDTVARQTLTLIDALTQTWVYHNFRNRQVQLRQSLLCCQFLARSE